MAKNIARSVSSHLKDHVTLEVECIDRLYLNAYVANLQYDGGVVRFFRHHRGHPFASSALMDPMTKSFVRCIESFTEDEGIPLISFKKGQRKDDVLLKHLAAFAGDEGVLFVGKAQEKVSAFRTQKRRNPETGATYPWLYRSQVMVNQYYFYILDEGFGPFFIKLSSYFPYNAKFCLNGHEYAKRQLKKEGIRFQALDNGVLSCDDPRRLQEICDGFSPEKIDAVFRKWLRRLPHPFTDKDRDAGYRYQLSILQAEFSLTQILDRPQTGRIFFEEVIRENLDLGRPDNVQLIFGRKIIRTTPGRFRTRVITSGVVPSLHIDYKSSSMKQYHKEGRGLRTEFTSNNSLDFGIPKRLVNLPALRKIGFPANRRLLDVQRLSHDCRLGEQTFLSLTRPALVDGKRVPALRFPDPTVMALLGALVVFRLLPKGFSNRTLREHVAPLLGKSPDDLSPGSMTYNLRRLRLQGLITRVPRSHHYAVTDKGFRVALFFTRIHARVFRHGLAQATPSAPTGSQLQTAFDRLDSVVNRWLEENQFAA
jgi:hypothetical protein